MHVQRISPGRNVQQRITSIVILVLELMYESNSPSIPEALVIDEMGKT